MRSSQSGARAVPRGVSVRREAGGLAIRYASRSAVDVLVVLFGLMLLGLAAQFISLLVEGLKDGARLLPLAIFGWLGVSMLGVGLYTVYRGLAKMVNQTVIRVSMQGVRVADAPLPLPGEEPLAVKAIHRAACVAEPVWVYSRGRMHEVELYHLRVETWERGEVDLLSGLGDARTVEFMAEEIEAWLKQQAGGS